ncbi:LLM class oxidoreductase [Pseudomonas lactucae]|uniref:hypothetical protein n=1 Tax=Pseudomonas lactucae TaxID=2813360 RepID=UPI002FCCC190
MLSQEARRLKFLLTLRPGTELLARAGTLQISESRLALHMVTGSSRFEKRSLGDFLE